MSVTEPILLGDPHLGKVFKTGVPFHRLGDREKTQWADFHQSLARGGEHGFHICVGDLFDQFTVPYAVVLQAARAYQDVARKHPSTDFVVLRGNHDGSRIAGAVSAYDVFAALMEDTPNVHVLYDEPQNFDRRLFVPWTPFVDAHHMVEPYHDASFDAVYGHWDVIDFGGSNTNLVPLPILHGMTGRVVTGHDHHKKTLVTPEGTQLVMTGSMQPYAHGEDAEDATDKRYRTVTLAELSAIPDTRDLCLRVKLRPGEDLPEGLDALQITTVRVQEQFDDTNTPEVDVAAFDLANLFKESCDEQELLDPTREALWENLR